MRAGDVLGRSRSSRVRFEVRPAGGERLQIAETRAIVEGWRMLAVTRASRGALVDRAVTPAAASELVEDASGLARRVLEDPRITIHGSGRDDIAQGMIDPRVLAVLAYLAENRLNPTVTSLASGRRSLFTASGNLSAHPNGRAVDIAAINGTPILGHQGAGSITDSAVRRLLALQGDLRPKQIITLARYAGADNTLGLADHDDHIHVGF